MSRFRKQLLFLCDAFLFAAAVLGYKFITVLLPYTEVGARGSFPKNVLLLYGCIVIAQLLFRTYDSLWRYAESREYLALLGAALCGFGAYEIFSRALLHESISFVLLAAIASLWVLEMLAGVQPAAAAAGGDSCGHHWRGRCRGAAAGRDPAQPQQPLPCPVLL